MADVYENDVVDAIAALLAGAGVADWQPTGVYPRTGGPAIYIGILPESDRPVITLTTYPVMSAWAPNDSVLGLQVRTRAPGRDVRATTRLDGAVYDVLHGLSNLQLGGHRVTKVSFQSGASMGRDASERWERTANYYITGPR